MVKIYDWNDELGYCEELSPSESASNVRRERAAIKSMRESAADLAKTKREKFSSTSADYDLSSRFNDTDRGRHYRYRYPNGKRNPR